MNNHFDTLKKSRILVLENIKELSLEQIQTIPKGFNNHILWNIAHLIVTQQLLHYKLSGLPLCIENDLVERYKKGSKPNEINPVSQKEFDEIKQLLLSLPEQLEKDYTKGKFIDYNNYTTSVGVTMTNIDEAIWFNNFHEALHLGSILALKKLV